MSKLCLLDFSKTKIPLFVHLADHSAEFEQNEVSFILKNCFELICITEDMKYKYESMLGIKEIGVLHNGAEERCYSIPSPPPPPFSKKNPFVLCFLAFFLIFMDIVLKISLKP